MAGEQYGKISRRMWRDEKFRQFSKAPPSARELWIYLLTSPRSTSIPGIVAVGAMGLAEDLDWPVKATRARLAELEAAGVVKVDHEAKLLWLPNSLDHNPPANASVVLGWRAAWRLLPECPLRTMAQDAIRSKLTEMDADAVRDGRPGRLFAQAFEVAVGSLAFADSLLNVGRQKKKADPTLETSTIAEQGVPHPGGHGADQQDQEQDQEQEQDQDRSDTHIGAASVVDQRPDQSPPTSRSAASASKPQGPDGVAEILAHLAASPHPLPLIATLDVARRFASATMTGATVPDIKHAITAALLKIGKHGRATASDQESIDALADFVGSFIVTQRSFDRKRGNERHAGSDVDVDRVVKHFADVWAKKIGRAYGITEADRDSARLIRDLAAQIATDEALRRPTATWTPGVADIVPHWISQYIADKDPFLADASWALRFLATRANKYELPKTPWGQKAPPKQPKPNLDLPPTKPPSPAELEAMARSRVNGGNGAIVLRSGTPAVST